MSMARASGTDRKSVLFLCRLLQEVIRTEGYITREEHKEFARRMEDEHHRQNRRIELLEENIGQLADLTLSVGKMANSMEGMLAEQKEQGKRLKTLEEVPVKNWNTVKVAILTAIGTAAGTGIVAAVINYL